MPQAEIDFQNAIGTDPENLLKEPALRIEFAQDILAGYCEFEFQYTKDGGNKAPWDEQLAQAGGTV